MTKGLFIVVDGIDGAGKTTQIALLRHALERAGESVVVSKEPTTGRWGSRLRASALTGRLSADEELDHFIRDREEHCSELIRPAIASGAIVLVDRYYHSTLAYQGPRMGDWRAIEQPVRAGVIEPDAVLILDLQPRIALERIVERDGAGNAFEREEDLILTRAVFRELAAGNASIALIDADQDRERVMREIAGFLLSGVFSERCCASSPPCSEERLCLERSDIECDWKNLRASLLAPDGGLGRVG